MLTDSPPATDAVGRGLARSRIVARYAILGAIVAYLVFLVALWLYRGLDVRAYGYPGVWLFSLIGASSVLVPVPGLAAVCFAVTPAAGLHPAVVGVVAASAEALGEMTGYLAGAGGSPVIERNRRFPAVKAWIHRRGALVFFALSSFPNPLFDVAGIAAGSVRYPVPRFLGATFLGKAVKSTWIAYGCYFGVAALQRLLGQ